LFFKHILISVCILSFSLSARLLQASVLSTAIPSPSVPPVPIDTIVVTVVKDGNIQVWDEATH